MDNNTNTARPTLTAMIGGPGAGKSYVIGTRFAGATVLDCDSIKAEHPDYDPKDPGALHPWSRDELVRRIYGTIAKGESFIYDGTGTNVERYVKLFNDAHDAGFNVEIVYVTCSLATALTRNANRTRNVPESIVREKHATVATAFEVLSRYSDSIRVINND